MMKTNPRRIQINKVIPVILVLLLASFQNSTFAAYYPSDFYYSEAGFNDSKPLQEKLKTTRGEFLFKETGLYIGASDAIYQDRIRDKEHYEMDAYAGIRQRYGNFGYNLGFKSYNRSIAKDVEVQEVYIGGFFQGIGLSYASNELGKYTQLNIKHKLSFATIGFHIGKTKLALGEAFSDWSIHASRMYKSMKFNAIMTKSEDPLNNDTQINLGIERSLSLF
ncbi:MAG TPA: hypothetical protein ENK06_14150 [Gammaproteobacteria bacterium]|nr:hypothetical protein [Gammaproteobacteria bacterium]